MKDVFQCWNQVWYSFVVKIWNIKSRSFYFSSALVTKSRSAGETAAYNLPEQTDDLPWKQILSAAGTITVGEVSLQKAVSRGLLHAF